MKCDWMESSVYSNSLTVPLAETSKKIFQKSLPLIPITGTVPAIVLFVSSQVMIIFIVAT